MAASTKEQLQSRQQMRKLWMCLNIEIQKAAVWQTET